MQGGGFGDVQPLSPTGTRADWVWFGDLPAERLILSWTQDESEIWYAQFDAESDTWSSAMLAVGALGSAICADRAGVRIAGFIAGGWIFAVHAEPGEGFSAPRNLRSPSGIEYGFCELDDWGNGHLFRAGSSTGAGRDRSPRVECSFRRNHVAMERAWLKERQ